MNNTPNVDLIPPETARATSEYYPQTGPDWLERLPLLIERYSRRWGLTVHPAFVGGEASWKAPVTLVDGTAAVLKIGVPSTEHQLQASAALSAWKGHGAVRLLDFDDEERVVLIERCVPGHDVFALSAQERNAAAIEVLSQIWIAPPAGNSFEELAERVSRRSDLMQRRFEFADDPKIDPALSKEAASLFEHLPSTAERRVLVHGDFGWGNVLLSERGWLAIDPAPMVGDPAFDVAWFIVSRRDFEAVHVQIEVLGRALNLDAQRISAWVFAETVHGLAWHIQAGNKSGVATRLEHLQRLRDDL